MESDNNFKPMISYFKPPITNTIPYNSSVTLGDVYTELTSCRIKTQTENLRRIVVKEDNKKYKADNFPFVTISGTFGRRNEKGLIEYSDLMVLDFDNVQDLQTVKLQLLKDPSFKTRLLFISPNGNGLKWVISTESRGKYTHSEFFDSVRNYIKSTYQLEIDKSGRDVARACFLCHDPEAYIHPKYLMKQSFYPEICQVERLEFNPEDWLIKTASKRTKICWQKSASLYAVNNSSATRRYEIDVITCRIENHKIDLTENYNDWVNIGFSLADEFGINGEDLFQRLSAVNSGYKYNECKKQFNKCLKSSKKGITIKTFFYLAKQAGVNIRV